jgi:uncharacterized protein (TIGR02147 family)
MDWFALTSYKDFLIQYLLFRKKARSSFTFEAMAVACSVQKTYLSKVLKHKGNLNLDQLYAACEYLKLKPIETEFVFALYHFETATHPARRALYQNQLVELRRRSLTTDAKISVSTEKIQATQVAEYYADPMFSLVHMFLTIDRFRKAPQLMGEILQLTSEKLSLYIDRLEKFGIIEQSGAGWKVIKDHMHLPEDSVFVKAHRTLLRMKALEQLERLDHKDYYSFTVVFSSEESVQKEIRLRFLQFLDEVQKLVEKGREKEVFQLNFDLLKWS